MTQQLCHQRNARISQKNSGEINETLSQPERTDVPINSEQDGTVASPGITNPIEETKLFDTVTSLKKNDNLAPSSETHTVDKCDASRLISTNEQTSMKNEPKTFESVTTLEGNERSKKNAQPATKNSSEAQIAVPCEVATDTSTNKQTSTVTEFKIFDSLTTLETNERYEESSQSITNEEEEKATGTDRITTPSTKSKGSIDTPDEITHASLVVALLSQAEQVDEFMKTVHISSEDNSATFICRITPVITTSKPSFERIVENSDNTTITGKVKNTEENLDSELDIAKEAESIALEEAIDAAVEVLLPVGHKYHPEVSDEIIETKRVETLTAASLSKSETINAMAKNKENESVIQTDIVKPVGKAVKCLEENKVMPSDTLLNSHIVYNSPEARIAVTYEIATGTSTNEQTSKETESTNFETTVTMKENERSEENAEPIIKKEEDIKGKTIIAIPPVQSKSSSDASKETKFHSRIIEYTSEDIAATSISENTERVEKISQLMCDIAKEAKPIALEEVNCTPVVLLTESKNQPEDADGISETLSQLETSDTSINSDQIETVISTEIIKPIEETKLIETVMSLKKHESLTSSSKPHIADECAVSCVISTNDQMLIETERNNCESAAILEESEQLEEHFQPITNKKEEEVSYEDTSTTIQSIQASLVVTLLSQAEKMDEFLKNDLKDATHQTELKMREEVQNNVTVSQNRGQNESVTADPPLVNHSVNNFSGNNTAIFVSEVMSEVIVSDQGSFKKETENLQSATISVEVVNAEEVYQSAEDKAEGAPPLMLGEASGSTIETMLPAEHDIPSETSQVTETKNMKDLTAVRLSQMKAIDATIKNKQNEIVTPIKIVKPTEESELLTNVTTLKGLTSDTSLNSCSTDDSPDRSEITISSNEQREASNIIAETTIRATLAEATLLQAETTDSHFKNEQNVAISLTELINTEMNLKKNESISLNIVDTYEATTVVRTEDQKSMKTAAPLEESRRSEHNLHPATNKDEKEATVEAACLTIPFIGLKRSSDDSDEIIRANFVAALLSQAEQADKFAENDTQDRITQLKIKNLQKEPMQSNIVLIQNENESITSNTSLNSHTVEHFSKNNIATPTSEVISEATIRELSSFKSSIRCSEKTTLTEKIDNVEEFSQSMGDIVEEIQPTVLEVASESTAETILLVEYEDPLERSEGLTETNLIEITTEATLAAASLPQAEAPDAPVKDKQNLKSTSEELAKPVEGTKLMETAKSLERNEAVPHDSLLNFTIVNNSPEAHVGNAGEEVMQMQDYTVLSQSGNQNESETSNTPLVNRTIDDSPEEITPLVTTNLENTTTGKAGEILQSMVDIEQEAQPSVLEETNASTAEMILPAEYKEPPEATDEITEIKMIKTTIGVALAEVSLSHLEVKEESSQLTADMKKIALKATTLESTITEVLVVPPVECKYQLLSSDEETETETVINTAMTSLSDQQSQNIDTINTIAGNYKETLEEAVAISSNGPLKVGNLPGIEASIQNSEFKIQLQSDENKDEPLEPAAFVTKEPEEPSENDTSDLNCFTNMTESLQIEEKFVQPNLSITQLDGKGIMEKPQDNIINDSYIQLEIPAALAEYTAEVPLEISEAIIKNDYVDLEIMTLHSTETIPPPPGFEKDEDETKYTLGDNEQLDIEEIKSDDFFIMETIVDSHDESAVRSVTPPDACESHPVFGDFKGTAEFSTEAGPEMLRFVETVYEGDFEHADENFFLCRQHDSEQYSPSKINAPQRDQQNGAKKSISISVIRKDTIELPDEMCHFVCDQKCSVSRCKPSVQTMSTAETPGEHENERNEAATDEKGNVHELKENSFVASGITVEAPELLLSNFPTKESALTNEKDSSLSSEEMAGYDTAFSSLTNLSEYTGKVAKEEHAATLNILQQNIAMAGLAKASFIQTNEESRFASQAQEAHFETQTVPWHSQNDSDYELGVEVTEIAARSPEPERRTVSCDLGVDYITPTFLEAIPEDQESAEYSPDLEQNLYLHINEIPDEKLSITLETNNDTTQQETFCPSSILSQFIENVPPESQQVDYSLQAETSPVEDTSTISNDSNLVPSPEEINTAILISNHQVNNATNLANTITETENTTNKSQQHTKLENLKHASFSKQFFEEEDASGHLSNLLPGSIAEREHKKWYNAVEMPNNPYSREALHRRLSETTKKPVDIATINSPLEKTGVEKSINSSNEQEVITTKPKVDFQRYSRDYYVNDAKHASGSSRQNFTSSASSFFSNFGTDQTEEQEQLKTTVIQRSHSWCDKRSQSTSASDIFTARPIRVEESDPILSKATKLEYLSTPDRDFYLLPTEEISNFCSVSASEHSLSQVGESLTPSEDSDTVRIYDLKTQQTRIFLDDQLNKSEDSVSHCAISPLNVGTPQNVEANDTSQSRLFKSTISRGSTPSAFKFLQPKRKLYETRRFMSEDASLSSVYDRESMLRSSVEKSVIEEDVIPALPSVKALAKAFQGTSQDSTFPSHKPEASSWKSAVEHSKKETTLNGNENPTDLSTNQPESPCSSQVLDKMKQAVSSTRTNENGNVHASEVQENLETESVLPALSEELQSVKQNPIEFASPTVDSDEINQHRDAEETKECSEDLLTPPVYEQYTPVERETSTETVEVISNSAPSANGTIRNEKNSLEWKDDNVEIVPNSNVEDATAKEMNENVIEENTSESVPTQETNLTPELTSANLIANETLECNSDKIENISCEDISTKESSLHSSEPVLKDEKISMEEAVQDNEENKINAESTVEIDNKTELVSTSTSFTEETMTTTEEETKSYESISETVEIDPLSGNHVSLNKNMQEVNATETGSKMNDVTRNTDNTTEHGAQIRFTKETPMRERSISPVVVPGKLRNSIAFFENLNNKK